MSILSDSQYEKIHTGSAIETKRLQSILEEHEISSIVRDDNESAKLGGYALGSPDNTRLLVGKQDIIKAKRIVASTLQDFENNAISASELENLAQNTKAEPKITYTSKKASAPSEAKKISKGLAFFYFSFIAYSLWRLYPLLEGEELPMWRIAISGALIIFCLYRLIEFFKK
ncbi:putative signal transducing protein [Dokdonia sp. Hel_I_53]|uniref:putative signal transducing protein n=1 Tax=Dokdonia sp. Hel_I_53 TaxID=1566287 RepID=UPI00119B34EC|nr:DUF2007 domain-containing protein [Dokdonia sp. Hel_I_53]TVZ51036.1 putative signal transducing protein [Dokdonia sp. Hel_I_53]